MSETKTKLKIVQWTKIFNLYFILSQFYSMGGPYVIYSITKMKKNFNHSSKDARVAFLFYTRVSLIKPRRYAFIF